MYELFVFLTSMILGLGLSYLAWRATDLAIPPIVSSKTDKPKTLTWVVLTVTNALGFSVFGFLYVIFAILLGASIVMYFYEESLRIAALRVVLWSFFTFLIVIGFAWLILTLFG